MIADPFRAALIREQFATPVREYRPGLEPIDDIAAARNRRVLCESLQDRTDDTLEIA